ncbi:hypothetical protein EC957_007988 [Mortierella hygrophila]|uniref:Uncharacterized protein n=1 Tax=Mortierella hygrophila TaxID=979708 RepID=A0A9P6JYD5_9FUNG|nr:hypothetical protein EC957_007988 [Mortierella hygrophila]
MIFDDSYYNYFYQPNSYQQHHLEQQQLLQLHQTQLQYPLQQHQQQMLDEDQEYLYEASQAQEDWLDAVLEDLIDDDQDNDDDDEDISSPEYDDSDDAVAGDYNRDTFDEERRQLQLSEPPAIIPAIA